MKSLRTIFVFLIIAFFIIGKLHAQWEKVTLPDSIYNSQVGVASLTVCNGNIYAYAFNDGIFRSTNNGLSWEHINCPDPYLIMNLFSTNDKLFLNYADGKFLRSTDNGTTWEAINNTFLKFFYHTPESISYANIRSLIHGSNNIFIGTDIGIFRSTDEGISWMSSSNGLPSNLNNSDPKTKVQITQVLMYNSHMISHSRYVIFMSDDNGINWQAVENNGINGLPVHPVSGGPIIESMIAKDSLIFAAIRDFGVYLSNDTCKSWIGSNNGIPEFTTVKSFAIKDSLIFAQTYNSIYVSKDNGNNWELVNQGSYNDISILGSNILTCSKGVSISSDNGITWTDASNGLSVQKKRIVESFDGYDSILAVNTSDGSNFISTDFGLTWINEYISGSNISNYVNPEQTFFRLNRHNFFKLQNDTTWKEIYGPHSEPNWPTGQSSLYTKDLVKIDTFFIAVTNQGVCRTGISNEKLYSLYTSIDYWDKVFTQSSGYTLSESGNNIFLGTDNGVYTSTDLGHSWELTGLQGISIPYIFAVGSNILACSNYDTYRSKNSGHSWEYLNIGLSAMDNIVLVNDKIFAFKLNRTEIGMGPTIRMRSFDDIITNIKVDDKIPTEFSLSQNYPNPFNPTTTIKYSIAPPNLPKGEASQLVLLKVYDMLGREVATLVNEEKLPGNYEVTFNGRGLASGVYLYRLQAGSFFETKKFVLIK